MKLENKTDLPDRIVRRVVSWVCGELEVPVKKIRRAKFLKMNATGGLGRAWCRSWRILVRIGPPSAYPIPSYVYPGRKSESFRMPQINDQIEAAVAITAHEITHLREYAKGNGCGERQTTYEERRVLLIFQQRRAELLARWGYVPPAAEMARAIQTLPATAPIVEPLPAPAEPTPKPVKKSNDALIDARANAAAAALKRWERKLKLARTKVRKARARVRYYERRQAARGGSHE